MVVHIWNYMNFLLKTKLHSTTFESENVELAEQKGIQQRTKFKKKKKKQ